MQMLGFPYSRMTCRMSEVKIFVSVEIVKKVLKRADVATEPFLTHEECKELRTSVELAEKAR